MDLEDRGERAERIRRLNDELRTTFAAGQIFVTQGVQAFDGMAEVLDLVRTYNTFNKHNDPHGEHDFGAFEFRGEKFFWKMDYYGEDLSQGSEDPSDPAKTTRVLTIMLASEY
jgi:hypothetical protein